MFANNEFKVQEEYVIVAGGSRGLGRELALQLAEKGANVIVLARDQAALDETMEAMQRRSIRKDQVLQAESLDLADPLAVTEFISSLQVTPAALLCVAGGAAQEVGFFADIPADAISSCMTKNYLTSAFIAQAVLKRWTSVTGQSSEERRVRRHLVFTASTAALVTVPGYAAYSPTKAALRCLADSLRQEVLMYHTLADIKVHCSFPGTIYTESFYKEQELKPHLCKKIEGTIDNQGGMSAKEVAASILSGLGQGQAYLTSDFQTRLLLNNMRGPSPRDSPIIDWVLGFLISLIWPLIGKGIDRAVYQYEPRSGSS